MKMDTQTETSVNESRMVVWTNTVEWITAENNLAALEAVYKAHYGYTPVEITGDIRELEHWSIMPDDDELYIMFERAPEYDEPRIRVTPAEDEDRYHKFVATAQASVWAEVRPNQYLCTSEY